MNDNNEIKDNDNKNILDGSIINKKYINNFEELDFSIFKDSRKNEIKENKKKKITFEEIQKKYKTQDMGSDFLNSDQESNKDEKSDITQEKQNLKKNPKKKKNKKIKENNPEKIKCEDETNNLDNSEDNKNSNDYSDNTELSQDNEDNNKKKKKGRKRKKKEEKVYSIEEELPDPETLDSVALALEMKKYGMKPQNKKRNIEILKSVYNFLRIKELPENLSRKLSFFDLDNDENNADSENDFSVKGSKKNDASNITELSIEQKKNIIDIIKENKNIYEKILLFKEVSLKEIKSILTSKGVIIANHLLSKLLIDSGVILPGGWNDKK